MTFSSPAFIFAFLPIFLVIYYLVPNSVKNLTILVASLLFYYVDGGVLTLILCASIIFNFIIALSFSRLIATKRKILLVIGLSLNLMPLLYYKYWGFFVQSFVDVSSVFDQRFNISFTQILLPAGISFYTFHAISYLIDVYNSKVKPTSSLIDFGMYMTNFPQLIAGPIVRYSEIVDVVRERKVRLEQIYSGLLIFTIGLSKKIILADSVGSVADNIYALQSSELTTGIAWLGAFAYTLQIYFDFSGYSDMAIGLGRMMGFEFPQNFNQPYRSKNVTEFWRRWHMTLSRWFRDYLYIPLGGNRVGESRTLINLLIVFYLCGLWHGASYGFIVWGIYHGMLLIIERELLTRFDFRMSGWLGQAVTFLLIMFGWVIFRSASLADAISYFQVMTNTVDQPLPSKAVLIMLGPDKLTFLVIAFVCAIFPREILEKIHGSNESGSIVQIAQGFAALALMSYSCMLIASNGFNPFIYFRF
jgi:alginate O-acetyltransferase complex protein AlgI